MGCGRKGDGGRRGREGGSEGGGERKEGLNVRTGERERERESERDECELTTSQGRRTLI